MLMLSNRILPIGKQIQLRTNNIPTLRASLLSFWKLTLQRYIGRETQQSVVVLHELNFDQEVVHNEAWLLTRPPQG